MTEAKFQEMQEAFYKLYPDYHTPSDDSDANATFAVSPPKGYVQPRRKISDEQKNEEREKRLHILIDIRKNGTPEQIEWANTEIWNETAGFVKNRIRQYTGGGGNFSDIYEDLMTECASTIFENIDKYESGKGRLSTFLTWPLVHTITERITVEVNKTSAYYSQNIRKVEKAIEYFKQMRVEPSIADISVYTKLSIPKVEDSLERMKAKNMMSLDDEDFDEASSEYGNPVQSVIESDEKNMIYRAISELSEIDQQILTMRFDLQDKNGKEMSISAIAKKLNLQPEKVSKSLNGSLRKLSNNRILFDYFGKSRRDHDKGIEKITRSTIVDDFFDDCYDDDGTEEYSEFIIYNQLVSDAASDGQKEDNNIIW